MVGLVQVRKQAGDEDARCKELEEEAEKARADAAESAAKMLMPPALGSSETGPGAGAAGNSGGSMASSLASATGSYSDSEDAGPAVGPTAGAGQTAGSTAGGAAGAAGQGAGVVGPRGKNKSSRTSRKQQQQAAAGESIQMLQWQMMTLKQSLEQVGGGARVGGGEAG